MAVLATVALSAVIFLPFLLLLVPLEFERGGTYETDVRGGPLGILLDNLLFGMQVVAVFLHTTLLLWAVLAGIGILRGGFLGRATPGNE